ncbi:hypothetical protein H1C71_041216, partial [Ictidomys tridecemlineatus]
AERVAGAEWEGGQKTERDLHLWRWLPKLSLAPLRARSPTGLIITRVINRNTKEFRRTDTRRLKTIDHFTLLLKGCFLLFKMIIFFQNIFEIKTFFSSLALF